MSQKLSAFITGANARVKVGDVTLAYATDVSYNMVVQTIPVETMGTYEVRDNVPVAYTVDGTFSVVRYTSNAAALGGSGGQATSIPDNSATGNAPGKISHLGTHLNPATILQSGTFDLEIQERLAKDIVAITEATETAAASTETTERLGVFRVRDCRLTRRGATLNKRGVLVDQYAFVGVLGEDFEGGDAASALSGFPDLA